MNRRSFFGRLVGGSVALAATEAGAQSLKVDLRDDFLLPEPYPANLALAGVMPICPRCGMVLWIDGPLGGKPPLEPLPASCGNCKWVGVAPRAMRITS